LISFRCGKIGGGDSREKGKHEWEVEVLGFNRHHSDYSWRMMARRTNFENSINEIYKIQLQQVVQHRPVQGGIIKQVAINN